MPVIRFEHLSAAQKRAYRIGDNQLTLNSTWDEPLLAEETGWLRDEKFDLDLLGFDASELERLLAIADGEGEPAGAEDEVPEPPEEPVSKPGDLWVLGNHRLLCGDATVLADIERVLGGQLADMVFCDPPYGVNYANSPKDKLRGKHRPILNDNLGAGFEGFLHDACVNILSVTKGACYAGHAPAGVSDRRWSLVDLRDLGQAHLHARPERLSAAVRTDPLRLEGGRGPLLVRGPRPGRRLVLRQAGAKRPAPDDEAGGPGRARNSGTPARAATSCSTRSAARARP